MNLLENIMPSATFTGVSGKNYTYWLVSDDILLSLQAGNFIFASGDATHPVPVFIGAVEAHTVSGLWDIAITHLFRYAKGRDDRATRKRAFLESPKLL